MHVHGQLLHRALSDVGGFVFSGIVELVTCQLRVQSITTCAFAHSCRRAILASVEKALAENEALRQKLANDQVVDKNNTTV